MRSVCSLDAFVETVGQVLERVGRQASQSGSAGAWLAHARVASLRIELPVRIHAVQGDTVMLEPTSGWTTRFWQARIYRLSIEWPAARAGDADVFLEGRLLRRYRLTMQGDQALSVVVPSDKGVARGI
ncbi:MAG: hypothetical protein ABN482_01785 [Corticimicrobacter sp.]|uniref:hypothetical protein n=1 Tax=Corticimicrobacter sp. TaxID=2678536 RepID=UPI0032DB3EFC